MKARENPFRSECLERLTFREPGFSWEELEDRLAMAGGRGAIVGPEGHGKTTLLLQWCSRYKAIGRRAVFVRLESGQRWLTETQKRMLANAEALFVDSAEQLGWLGWQEFVTLTRSAHRIVVATHRPGRFAPIHFCRTSPEILYHLVSELHEPQNDCRELWQRHHGNLRNALRELYDTMGSKGRL